MQPNDFSVRLGENLRIIRKRRGWSAEYVADLMDLSTDSIYKYEKGERVFPLELALRTSKVLKISIMEMLSGLDFDDPNDINEAYNVLSPSGSAIMRNLATKWDGDIETLVIFMGMVAAWPEEYRREFYLQGSVLNDQLLANKTIAPESQPPGMDYMKSCIGKLYDK